MKEKLTEMVFIIDRSGSMAGLESDTVGGFNATVEKQKKEDGEALVSTVLFANGSEVLHDRRDIREIAPMTEREYSVGGCTALLDAVGGAIHHIRNVHKYIREEDVPAKTVFVIITDGMENASREYGSAQVKSMIAEQEAQGWEFLFLAANIDAAQAAEGIGIRRERAVNYVHDDRGTARVYEGVSRAMSAVRKSAMCADCAAPLDESWREEIDADFAARGTDSAATPNTPNSTPAPRKSHRIFGKKK